MLVWALACAPERGDAGWYAAALADATDHASAKQMCAEIGELRLRSDCQVAAMERWGGLAEAECLEVSDPVWADECRFQLAERLRVAGDLAGGIDACHRTRFRRQCSWHLLQDEAQDSVDETPAEAQRRLRPFAASNPLPDAGRHFWAIRMQEQNGAGRSADETDCDQVADSQSCTIAFERHVHRTLDALGRANLAKVCGAETGQRAFTREVPTWLPGPLATAAERRWVDARCTQGEPMKRPPGPGGP